MHWKIENRGQTTAPKLERRTGRYKKSQLTQAEVQEHKLLLEQVPGKKNLTVINNQLEVKIYTQACNIQTAEIKDQEKNLKRSLLGGGGGQGVNSTYRGTRIRIITNFFSETMKKKVECWK